MFRLIIVLIISVFGCQTNNSTIATRSLVNPAHLDQLYEPIHVYGRSMAVIHIYSEHPDYQWTWEAHEGIACVDDVARAVVFYTQYYSRTGDKTYLKKITELSEFLLYMQAENGYFYNFVLEDIKINKTYKRSIPIGNWWTWRALWALTEIYPVLISENKVLAERIWQSMERTVNIVINDYNLDREYRLVDGFRIPKWLPSNGGSDQGATLVLGLKNFYKYDENQQVYSLIEFLCDGIAEMQAGDSLQFPYGAYLSWENNWHAWGSVQSYVLLNTFKLIQNDRYMTGSLMEINYFYNYLIKEKYACEIKFKKQGDTILKLDYKKAPQIAYGIRPMIYACLEAFKITGQSKYAKQAGKIASWFFGDNFAQEVMYDPQTGICYDGINDDGDVNLNSGAESTIEALLALQSIEKNPQARKILMNYYLKNEH